MEAKNFHPVKDKSDLIPLCFFFLFLSSVHAADHSSKMEMESLALHFSEARQALTDVIEKDEIPGLAIAVVDRERILWSDGFGVRDRVSGEPVTPETVFSIQSISKTFTATAVMLAVQDGLVDLDTPITDYLPEFTVNSRFEENPEGKMTLRHLLSHTAGFTHEAPVGNNFNAASPSFNAHVASVSDTWLRFPVGERFAYSNLGIDLAGFIIQEASGIPFETYVKERLLEPLGMHASFVDTPELNGACSSCASGHWDRFERLPDYIPLTGSGGLRVSAEDGARFVRFHLNEGKLPNGRLIAPEYLHAMYRPHRRDAAWPSNLHYGLGVAAVSVNDLTSHALNHDGGGFGFGASMTWFPEHGFGYVVLVNSTSDLNRVLEALNELTKKLISSQLVSKVSPGEVLAADELFSDVGITDADRGSAGKVEEANASFTEGWSEVAGEYRFIYRGGFEVRVIEGEKRTADLRLTTKDGNFFVALGGGEPQPLMEHLPGLFFCKNSGEALDFRHDPPTWRNIELERTGELKASAP